MSKPSISELEALRAKMTPGPYRQGAVEKYNVFCPCEDALAPELGRVLLAMNPHFPYVDDAAGLVAEHNAMPALLALAKAASAWRAARAARREHSVNATDPFVIVSTEYQDECDRLYAVIDERAIELESALQAVRP